MGMVSIKQAAQPKGHHSRSHAAQRGSGSPSSTCDMTGTCVSQSPQHKTRNPYLLLTASHWKGHTSPPLMALWPDLVTQYQGKDKRGRESSVLRCPGGDGNSDPRIGTGY